MAYKLTGKQTDFGLHNKWALTRYCVKLAETQTRQSSAACGESQQLLPYLSAHSQPETLNVVAYLGFARSCFGLVSETKT